MKNKYQLPERASMMSVSLVSWLFTASLNLFFAQLSNATQQIVVTLAKKSGLSKAGMKILAERTNFGRSVIFLVVYNFLTIVAIVMRQLEAKCHYIMH